jgi:hypothetical protein
VTLASFFLVSEFAFIHGEVGLFVVRFHELLVRAHSSWVGVVGGNNLDLRSSGALGRHVHPGLEHLGLLLLSLQFRSLVGDQQIRVNVLVRIVFQLEGSLAVEGFWRIAAQHLGSESHLGTLGQTGVIHGDHEMVASLVLAHLLVGLALHLIHPLQESVIHYFASLSSLYRIFSCDLCLRLGEVQRRFFNFISELGAFSAAEDGLKRMGLHFGLSVGGVGSSLHPPD